jgi:NTP pyrophosphatase (non-canonical NTP hydrolase)
MTYQEGVDKWLLACFGEEIARDKAERSHRFIEEALELVQAAGCSKEETLALVDYVYGRDVGEIKQEVGGVMNTLAALCLAYGIDMTIAAEAEMARCWLLVDKIRAKQAAKPKFSPLPQ